MSRYRFLAEANEELRAAAEYYDVQFPGLGRELVVEVRRVCRTIAETPQIGKSVRPNITSPTRAPLSLLMSSTLSKTTTC